MIPLHTQSRLPWTMPIAAVRRETENVTTFTFNITYKSKPGQFLMVWLPGVDEVPMSIALDDGKQLKITFFAVGDMTRKLAQLKVGDLVGLRGPFGTHYEWKPKQHLILVAGGYGAAPMFFAAHEAVKDDCTIDFIIGARSKEHLLYIDDIAAMKNMTLHIATDDGSKGFKGYNTQILEKLLNTKKEFGNREQGTGDKIQFPIPNSQFPTTVFSCGPELMMKRVAEICAAKNVDCFLSMERFMKCGFGLCGNCVVDPTGERMCVNGPVIPGVRCLEFSDFGAYHRDALGKKHKL